MERVGHRYLAICLALSNGANKRRVQYRPLYPVIENGYEWAVTDAAQY
jgi:hypothetical protein